MKIAFTIFILSLPSFFQITSPSSSKNIDCPIEKYKNESIDASTTLNDCIDNAEKGAVIEIPPGKYKISQQLKIRSSITIKTKVIRGSAPCSHKAEESCAVLLVGMLPSSESGKMPIEIEGHNVVLQSLIIQGGVDRSKVWEKRICLNDIHRPLAGGIRVKGDSFHMANVVLRNFSCYTALEVMAGVKGLSVTDSLIGPNGQHDTLMMWADGITVHDAASAVIQNNTFLDNTDVQLIFGGCTECIVKNNSFRHSSSFKRASFAELMLHAWSNTSGNFSGSVTSQNKIDCGRSRRCGYGIMIGGEPWYPAKTFGGTVSANKVSNAQLGINVDHLTGGMTIQGNSVTMSGGMANSDCGHRVWPAINVSKESRNFLTTDIKDEVNIETRGCLLNRNQ
ncbi:right-handed parallel beta-helix repeat-containing protein [Novosphingobium sp. 9U]|uniref:right-handed parallel beta-helix repeat-containing protein n=1 Tax=Novosphingobium sp. 9U TaxID=2653158 RepID=UPI0012F1A6AB|nr:right-handed parallel beta-helix repeat-containing protein [Novosphingobium sp. 9U]VWX53875.1 conserved hypothetical protein [Novosphingobium sp. 9U]